MRSSSGSAGSFASAACARASSGSSACGRRASNSRSAWARSAPAASPPFQRFHDRSMPSNGSRRAGALAHRQVLDQRAAALGRAEALRLVMAPREPRQLAHRAPEQRVVCAHVHDEPRRVHGRATGKERVPQEPLRLPRLHRIELVGEARGVGGRGERLFGQDRRRGVVAVAGGRVGGKARDDDVGAEAADRPHDVREHRVVAPELEGLLRVLGESEIQRAREALFGAVRAARGQQLLRADHAERRTQLLADQVLAAITARHGQVRGAHAFTCVSHARSAVFSSSGCAAT